MRLKNKKKRLHYQKQQRQLQDSYFEILIGMKSMVRRAPLFPLIWPLQCKINKTSLIKTTISTLKIYLVVSQPPASYRQSNKIRDPWNEASLLLSSASRPGRLPQLERSRVGHTPHAYSPKSGHQRKEEYRWFHRRCHPCARATVVFPTETPLLFLETESTCWPEHPFPYFRARIAHMEIRSSNLHSY